MAKSHLVRGVYGGKCSVKKTNTGFMLNLLAGSGEIIADSEICASEAFREAKVVQEG